jgi:hypothetical protein
MEAEGGRNTIAAVQHCNRGRFDTNTMHKIDKQQPQSDKITQEISNKKRNPGFFYHLFHIF